MTFDEAKELLARVAVLDNRVVDSVTVKLWQEILDPFTLDECMWALREFARTNSEDYLRPAHLVEIIRRKRSDYAAMNPGRESATPGSWLAFEDEIEQVRVTVNAIRAQGHRYAVEAMEQEEEHGQ